MLGFIRFMFKNGKLPCHALVTRDVSNLRCFKNFKRCILNRMKNWTHIVLLNIPVNFEGLKTPKIGSFY